MVAYTTQESVYHVLTPEGVQLCEQGSHEARVWAAVPAKGSGAPVVGVKELKATLGDESAKVGQGRAFKNGWVGKEGEGLVKLVDKIQDVTQEELKELESTGTLKAGEKTLADLRKRKLAIQKSVSLLDVVYLNPTGLILGRSLGIPSLRAPASVHLQRNLKRI